MRLHPPIKRQRFLDLEQDASHYLHSRHWFLHNKQIRDIWFIKEDTGQVQVESIFLVSIFVSTDKFLYDRSHGCDRSL